MASAAGIEPINSSCNGPPQPAASPPKPPQAPAPTRRRIMRIAVYLRASTLRQAQAQSCEQQLDRLQTHILAQDWHLSPENIFRDDGYSGASLKRPGLDRLRDSA